MTKEKSDSSWHFADGVFKKNCRMIIDTGASNEGEDVRTVWPDGTPAYTKKLFGVVNRYEIYKDFPALTLRPTGLKNCFDEILWIWQKKSNRIEDLHSHIWDAWALPDGTIGKAYGYQLGVKHEYKEGMFDQVDRVLYDLEHNPFSRRIMTNLYVHQDLHEMALYPCAYSVLFNAEKKPNRDKLVLNAMLMQRSQDMLTANNWNVCQYSLLLMMIARHVDMIPGTLTHVIGDAHIYDRHIMTVKQLLLRQSTQDYVKVYLNPDVHNFYDFTVDDLIIEDYRPNKQVKFEVAI